VRAAPERVFLNAVLIRIRIAPRACGCAHQGWRGAAGWRGVGAGAGAGRPGGRAAGRPGGRARARARDKERSVGAHVGGAGPPGGPEAAGEGRARGSSWDRGGPGARAQALAAPSGGRGAAGARAAPGGGGRWLGRQCLLGCVWEGYPTASLAAAGRTGQMGPNARGCKWAGEGREGACCDYEGGGNGRVVRPLLGGRGRGCSSRSGVG
jgi:hypothetical protein